MAVADGKKSATEIIVLLFAGGVGTGVLVLPTTMSAVGFMAMFVLLAIGSLLSAATTWMLMMGVTHARQQSSGSSGQGLLAEEEGQKPASFLNGPSYGELLTMATAPAMSTVLDVMLIIYAGGAIVSYYLFLAGFVERLPFWPEALTLNWTIAILAVITYPATLLPTIGRLAKLANIVVVVLFVMTFSIWFRAPAAAAARTSPVLAVNDVDKCGAALCICIYAFVWHNNCVAVSRELRDPTPMRCAGISLGATTLLCVVYAFIAFGGYWSFGSDLKGTSSIMDAYDINDPLFIMLRLALTASLLVSIDLNIFPLRESCCGLVRKIVPGYEPSAMGHGGWSLFIIVTASTAAIVCPGVTKLISFLGGTIGPCMCIIFPVLISRMVLSHSVWLLALAILVPISLFLNASALGLIGTPV